MVCYHRTSGPSLLFIIDLNLFMFLYYWGFHHWKSTVHWNRIYYNAILFSIIFLTLWSLHIPYFKIISCSLGHFKMCNPRKLICALKNVSPQLPPLLQLCTHQNESFNPAISPFAFISYLFSYPCTIFLKLECEIIR